MSAIDKEKNFYDNFWEGLKGGYAGDKWSFPSNESHPAIDGFIKFLKKEKAKGRLLDIGCGNAKNSIALAKKGYDCYGVELSTEAIKIAKRNIKEQGVKYNIQAGNILNLSYKNNQFDILIDSGCLHHMRKYQWPAYLKNILRVLRPGGYYFLICFSINTDFRKIGTYKNVSKKKNWLVSKGHFSYFFREHEVIDLFKKDFEIKKLNQIDRGGFPLMFWVVYMQKK